MIYQKTISHNSLPKMAVPLKKAITVQVTGLLKSPPENSKVTLPDPNDMTKIDVELLGPEGTPYEGGHFHAIITLDADAFPNKPPEVTFTTKIYHPNVDNKTGSACIPLILEKEWRPGIKLTKLIQAILEIMKNPIQGHELDPDIGAEYALNRDKFNQTAKQWTQEYAH